MCPNSFQSMYPFSKEVRLIDRQTVKRVATMAMIESPLEIHSIMVIKPHWMIVENIVLSLYSLPLLQRKGRLRRNNNRDKNGKELLNDSDKNLNKGTSKIIKITSWSWSKIIWPRNLFKIKNKSYQTSRGQKNIDQDWAKVTLSEEAYVWEFVSSKNA